MENGHWPVLALLLHEVPADLVAGVYEAEFAGRQEPLLNRLTEKRFAVLSPPVLAKTPRPGISLRLHREKPIPADFERRFHKVDGVGKWAGLLNRQGNHRSARSAEVAGNPDLRHINPDMATWRLLVMDEDLLASGELHHQLVGGRTLNGHVIFMYPQQKFALNSPNPYTPVVAF